MGYKLEFNVADDNDGFVERCPQDRFVRYNEILGEGTFKSVYKGFDEVEGIEVAWNRMTLDDAMKSPVEISLLKKLKHDNVMKSYVSWVDDKNKTVNMISELFISGTLRQYREKHKNVDLKVIKNWARQILQGLDYLHSHDPPIIHRDLKCDNIFVNGNHRQVKIGDLGFATLKMQPTVKGVLGTPEFMAPEVWEGEYNEFVDIYSFGMCILELITCEYPYSECRDHVQIYRKVTRDIKPAGLSKVKDPQVREFIEKCLVPASQRLCAKELLKDPFFSHESMKDQSLHEPVNLINSPKPNPCVMDNNITSTDSSSTNNSPRCRPVEVVCVSEGNYIRLKGVRNEDDNSVIMVTMTVNYFSGAPKKLEFPFYMDDDTALTVAQEMVEQQEILQEDVDVVAELIDYLIKQCVSIESF
ncbi:serine/threonine-protein kinase WNK8-like [Rutidosis leptorrhynchoides]|uniref:serine/threonine-protein kinase WNK8-like n=1 Tax=Rutidosis leptorrhynchoides TaxID=125765 RepID=UPI003A98DB8D